MEFAISVSELTSHIKRTLEEGFPEIKIIGEISNFKAHISGHWYFTLKDSKASINCTMWKGINNYVFFTPQDGMKIIVTGHITVYPPRGSYQIDVRSMKPAGEGELQKAFEELKNKLKMEGLFDEERKKEVPSFPQTIGIITGASTAALKDMLSVAQRRYPIVKLLIAQAKVQGEGATEEITSAIKKLNRRKDVDVIILARGGGSLEDLWAFNEEIVARAIFKSKIPVISGVGHEIDFTISDFVSDLRAPTPTAAMELATPNKDELFAFISDFSYTTTSNIFQKIEELRRKIDNLSSSYGFRNLSNIINSNKQTIDNILFRIQAQIGKFLDKKKNSLEIFRNIVSSNDVQHILKKGFVLVEQDNHYVKLSKKLKIDVDFILQFYDGKVKIKK